MTMRANPSSKSSSSSCSESDPLRAIRQRAEQATIARALDNAVKNGCMEELSKMSAKDIAYDLAQHDADCERMSIESLTAGVKAWLHPQPDDATVRKENARDRVQHVAAFCRQTARDGVMPSLAWFQETADDLDQLAECAAQIAALRGHLEELASRWSKAELDMRVLHGGLPGSGYDKLADGYGTCADELRDVLGPPAPAAQEPQG